MNVNTGELFRMTPEMEKKFAEAMTEKNSPIKAVPDAFADEADRLLGEKDSVFVDMGKESPLVDWAKRNQPHPDGNRKHRRRMAKESRRKNRK